MSKRLSSWRAASAWGRALSLVVLLCTPGCERREPPRAPTTQQSSPVTSTQPTEAELANVREFIRDAGRRRAPSKPAASAPTAGLKYEAPDSWVREPVESAMRADQYRLPHAAEDTEDGELTVFHFGPNDGGDIDAVVEMWRGQFSAADGGPIPDEAFSREAREINGLKITLIDVTGRFSAGSMRPGGQAAPARENYGLLAAIVETPAGPWYFKAAGPAATMEKHRGEFMEFVRSMTVR